MPVKKEKIKKSHKNDSRASKQVLEKKKSKKISGIAENKEIISDQIEEEKKDEKHDIKLPSIHNRDDKESGIVDQNPNYRVNNQLEGAEIAVDVEPQKDIILLSIERPIRDSQAAKDYPYEASISLKSHGRLLQPKSLLISAS